MAPCTAVLVPGCVETWAAQNLETEDVYEFF